MFTNPFFRNFFTLGQVTETSRGGGIFQPAVDEAVKLVQSGEWVGPKLAIDAEADKARSRSISSRKER